MWSRGVGIRRHRPALAVAAAALVASFAAAPAVGAADGEQKVETTTTITLNSPAPRTDTDISFTATVAAIPPESGPPVGGVDFFVDGVPQGDAVLDADGSATVDLNITEPGDHKVTATFNDQNLFTPSSATIGVTVKAPPGSDIVPDRPQLPEPIEPLRAPAPAAPARPAVAPAATPLPTELPNTGALTVPALLVGIAFLVVGLWCVTIARRDRRQLTLATITTR